jgi:hypothetical protein
MEKYIFSHDPNDWTQYKHVFLKIEEKHILDAEKRIGMQFPKDLRKFYTEIGAGFLCCNTTALINRFMDPISVADFLLSENEFEYNPNRENYEDNELVFFQVDEESFIYQKLDRTRNEIAQVYYGMTPIAKSLQDFLEKMDNEPDYYLKL